MADLFAPTPEHTGEPGKSSAKAYAGRRLRELSEHFERRAAQATTLSGRAYWASAAEDALAWAAQEDS